MMQHMLSVCRGARNGRGTCTKHRRLSKDILWASELQLITLSFFSVKATVPRHNNCQKRSVSMQNVRNK